MATNSDGSIIIGVNLNTDKAERNLGKLKNKIEQTERDISNMRQKRDEARQKSALDAAALDAEKAKLQEIKDRLADIRAMARDRGAGTVTRENAKSLIPIVEQELAEQREHVSGLQANWNKMENEVDRYDQKLKEAEETLNRQKEEAGNLQQQINDAEQRRIDNAKNAEVSDSKIVELNRELADLKARQAELSQSGLGLGYQEFDQNAARIAEITKELKEYQKALNGETGGAGKKPEEQINRTAMAAERMNAILSGTANLFQMTGRAISGAFQIANGAIQTTASLAISFGKNMNALSNLSDVFKKKFHYISRMIKRTFITFPILRGLREIRQQITSFLSVNAELSSSLSTLKGVFLTAFQPIYNVVVPALITLINVITRVVAAISEFTAVLFGTTAKKAQENAKALYSQANATSAAGSAAEEASLQMAAFDEINQLQGNKSGGGGGGGASTELGPSFDYEYDDTVFESWGEAFSAFLDKMLNNIPKLEAAFKNFADWLNDFSKKLYDMFTFPGVLEKVEQLGQDLANAFNKLTNWINWNQLGHALGAGMNLALQFLTELIYGYDWINLGKKLAGFINGLVSEIDWYDFGCLLWAGFKIFLETLAGFLLGLNMPELAKAASDLIKGFFDSMRETIENIDWRAIGEQIRTFLVNLDWPGIADSVFGAIKAAFMASSDFFSGLLGEELKRQLTDVLIMLGEFELVIGAILALSGANVPLGLGLMAQGALALGAASVLDWEYVSGNIKRIVTEILTALGTALLVIGAILLFSNAKPTLGVALMALGAASLATALAVNWDFLPNTISGVTAKVLAILGGALLVLGAILVFSSANIPLGIGLIAAGALSLASAAIINWEFIPNTISGIVSKISLILSVAFLALGALLTFTSANIPLGIGLMILGAISLATAAAVNWDILPNTLSGIVSKITAILSVAFLVLGAVLTFTGANIPLGLGLLVTGAIGLAATIAANWDAIPPKLQGTIVTITKIASVALIALGAVLIFTGAAIPLGLGMLAIGALGLASLIDPNWGGILEKLREVWGNITSWWDNGPSKYFTLEYWKGVAKGMVDGFLGGLQDIWRGLSSWASDVKRTIADAFSGASSGASYTKAGKYQRTSSYYGISRTSSVSMPEISSFNIPALAQGAVIPPNREFMAVLGDQKNGTNLEAPAGLIRQMVMEGIQASGVMNNGGNMTVIMEIDGREFGRASYKYGNAEKQRVGVSMTKARV